MEVARGRTGDARSLFASQCVVEVGPRPAIGCGALVPALHNGHSRARLVGREHDQLEAAASGMWGITQGVELDPLGAAAGQPPHRLVDTGPFASSGVDGLPLGAERERVHPRVLGPVVDVGHVVEPVSGPGFEHFVGPAALGGSLRGHHTDVVRCEGGAPHAGDEIVDILLGCRQDFIGSCLSLQLNFVRKGGELFLIEDDLSPDPIDFGEVVAYCRDQCLADPLGCEFGLIRECDDEAPVFHLRGSAGDHREGLRRLALYVLAIECVEGLCVNGKHHAHRPRGASIYRDPDLQDRALSQDVEALRRVSPPGGGFELLPRRLGRDVIGQLGDVREVEQPTDVGEGVYHVRGL